MWKIKDNKGSLTLEACISLTITFLVVISFMFFIKVVYVHSMMQHAVTQTANELANYSYLYSVSPLAPIEDAVVDSTGGSIDRLNYDIQEVIDVWDSVVKLKDIGTKTIDTARNPINSDYSDIKKTMQNLQGTLSGIEATADAAEQAYTQAGQALNTIRTNLENPKDLLKAVISIFVNGVNEDAKTLMGSLVCKTLMEKYIAVPGSNANSRLLNLQVIGGLNGLDFSGSRFFSDKQNIDLVVCYQMKNITPLKIMPDIYLINRATVRGWLNNGGPSSLSNSISIWDPSFSDRQRGLIIQKESGLRNLPNVFKTFSYFKDGVAVASMSIDPREVSYADEFLIKLKIRQKCEAIINFDGYKYKDVELNPDQINERQLVIFVPAKNDKNPDVNRSSIDNVVVQLQKEYPKIKIEVREFDKDISK